MAQPRLPDYATIEAMQGFTKADMMSASSIKRLLRINDEQIAVNRFFPAELPGTRSRGCSIFADLSRFSVSDREKRINPSSFFRIA